MLMANQSTYREFDYIDLGLIDYKEAWDFQKVVFDQKVKKVNNDTFLLLEHPHTYTLGKTADQSNLVSNEEFLDKFKISVYNIDRGGDITYHGPGQIVGYPIISLSDWKEDTHLYLRSLEEVIINTISHFGLKGERKKEYTGVWLEDRKICAIGIKISRWVTMHGFALNVNTNLDMFNGIIPCGIKDKQVTSIQKELNKEINISEVKEIILEEFINVFGYNSFNRKSKDIYTEIK